MGFSSLFSPLNKLPCSRLRFSLVLALTLSSCLAVQAVAQSSKSKAAPQAEADQLQQHYDAARTFSIGGDQQHAAIEYKAFLSEALRRTANVRTHQGNVSEADALFKAAIAIAP